jgi:hypothetical protein
MATKVVVVCKTRVTVSKTVGTGEKLPAVQVIAYAKTAVLSWNAEMQIRVEGYTKYSQTQRVGSEKI